MTQSQSRDDHGVKGWLLSRTGFATACVVLILGFLIYEGHGTHLLGLTPYLLILACPLMHIFMHGGHHRQHRENSASSSTSTLREEKKHGGRCH